MEAGGKHFYSPQIWCSLSERRRAFSKFFLRNQIVWNSSSEVMASLRRALSQNGSLFAVPSAPSHAAVNASAGLSPTALSSSGTAIPPTEGYYSKVGALALPSFLPLSWLRTTKTGASEKTKSKGSLVKKPIYLLAICFVLGLLLGLTPISWYGAQPGFELDNGFDTTPDEAGTRGDSERTTTTSVKSGSHPARLLGPRKVWTTPLKPLIIVTPTYNRPLQAYYLTRLAHTLRLVPPPLLWLVVEELSQSTETAQLLRQTGIMYRHLICNVTLSNIKDRGTSQRNTALAHIEHHQLDGIVYFADDDNIYSLELFEQLREIKRFGTWPVGMLAPGKSKTILEGPVCNGHEVVGWHTNEKSALLRRFHVDMSGFGFNSTILWDPRRWGKRSDEPIRQRDDIKEGMQETTFMEQLIEDESQMEGLPSGCSKVMVWHMHFETPGLPYPPGWTLSEHLIPVIPLQVSD